MKQTFEKESLMIDFVPISILVFFSVFFAVSSVYLGTLYYYLTGMILAVAFGFFPLKICLYHRSFTRISVSDRSILIETPRTRHAFTIPEDLGRVQIHKNDLVVELRTPDCRFVVRTHYLKNKMDFIRFFDAVIREHPPSPDKVIIKGSVIDIMNSLK